MEARKNIAQALETARRQESGDDEAWQHLGVLARQMEATGRARDDTVRTMFGFVGDRWSSLILLTLRAGEWRYGMLRRIISILAAEDEITQKVLTFKLKLLIRNGFVVRRSFDQARPATIYSLTDMGRDFSDRIVALIEWTHAHHDAIVACREADGLASDDLP